MGKSYEAHDFYCLNCGRKNIPLIRDCGKRRGKYHRKSLYCIWCKNTVNHIEICNQEEKEEFLEAFENGEFKEESKNSIDYIRNSGIR